MKDHCSFATCLRRKEPVEGGHHHSDKHLQYSFENNSIYRIHTDGIDICLHSKKCYEFWYGRLYNRTHHFFQKQTRIKGNIWHFAMQSLDFCSPLSFPLLFICIFPSTKVNHPKPLQYFEGINHPAIEEFKGSLLKFVNYIRIFFRTGIHCKFLHIAFWGFFV